MMKKIVLGGLSTAGALAAALAYPTSYGTDLTAVTDAPVSQVGVSTSGLSDGTYTGDVVDAHYGNVQVQVTVAGGVVSSANALVYPDRDGHSQRINSYAIPTLNTDASDGQIHAVTGATFTSRAYATSLQSALDQAAMGRQR